MGLYLCVFDGKEDVDGVDVGPYADFNAFRGYVVQELEAGRTGTKFPTLILHSDSDGEWTFPECTKLQAELTEIAKLLHDRPAVRFVSDWQESVAKAIGLAPRNAFESFIDVDGEFLLERLINLVDCALRRQQPILFQ